MGGRKKKLGVCKLCKEERELSFEHVPPRAAFNKHTRYLSIPSDEYFAIENLLENQPKGKIQQGGLGYYSFCVDCNNFLGREYVPEYLKWARALSSIPADPGDYVQFTLLDMNPLKIIKQIISMFIASNEDWYGEEFSELLGFVRNPEKQDLSKKFNLFFYLNTNGQFRNTGFTSMHTPELGFIKCNEITFPPVGYVLTYDYEYTFPFWTEITNFASYQSGKTGVIPIVACNLETHLAGMPLDYRKRESISKTISESLEFERSIKKKLKDY